MIRTRHRRGAAGRAPQWKDLVIVPAVFISLLTFVDAVMHIDPMLRDMPWLWGEVWRWLTK